MMKRKYIIFSIILAIILALVVHIKLDYTTIQIYSRDIIRNSDKSIIDSKYNIGIDELDFVLDENADKRANRTHLSDIISIVHFPIYNIRFDKLSIVLASLIFPPNKELYAKLYKVFTSDSDDKVFFVSNDFTIKFWDLKTGQWKVLKGIDNFIDNLVYIDEIKSVIANDEDNIYLWRINKKSNELEDSKKMGYSECKENPCCKR